MVWSIGPSQARPATPDRMTHLFGIIESTRIYVKSIKMRSTGSTVTTGKLYHPIGCWFLTTGDVSLP